MRRRLTVLVTTKVHFSRWNIALPTFTEKDGYFHFRFYRQIGSHILNSVIVAATVTAIVSDSVVCRSNRRSRLNTVYICNCYIRRSRDCKRSY